MTVRSFTVRSSWEESGQAAATSEGRALFAAKIVRTCTHKTLSTSIAKQTGSKYWKHGLLLPLQTAAISLQYQIDALELSNSEKGVFASNRASADETGISAAADGYRTDKNGKNGMEYARMYHTRA